MKWLTLFLQIMALRKGWAQTNALIDAAHSVAEKSKRAMIGVLGLAIACLFFFAAIMVAVIDLGLQIDSGNGVGYHGLMISATILVFIGIFVVAISYLLQRGSARIEEPVEAPRPSHNDREERIKELLEGFVVSFLSNLADKKRKPSGPET